MDGERSLKDFFAKTAISSLKIIIIIIIMIIIIIIIIILILIIIMIRRFKLVMKSQLNGKNKIKAANTWAVSLMRYGAGTIKWNKEELQGVDR